MRYDGQTFSNQSVNLDGNEFINCTFNECEFVYGATGPVLISGCTFHGGQWRFVGAASTTLEFIAQLYHGGFHELVESFFETIRHAEFSPQPARIPQLGPGWTVLLGSNVIHNCDAVLVVKGVEVFRLRERAGDGQLVADFEIRDEKNRLVAKVAKNNVVHAKESATVNHGTNFSEVVDTNTGQLLARAEELAPQKIRVVGTFLVDGYEIVATEDLLKVGGVVMAGNVISGFGTAIQIDEHGIRVG